MSDLCRKCPADIFINTAQSMSWSALIIGEELEGWC